MQERIEKELELLRRHYSKLEYRADGRWIRIPGYGLPEGWSPQSTDVAFQIPPAFPATPPYGIYVPAGIKFKNEQPLNYTESSSAQPPFGGVWGQFSWSTVDGQWRATAEPDPARGYTLVAWVKGFAVRFGEGR